MDPLTAWLLTTKAICEMITAIVQGQSPEVRAQAWAWWIADQDRMRKLFKIEP